MVAGKMEVTLSDDSCDSTETKDIKNQLSEFGLNEENLSKDEMRDLLKALNNSKSCTIKDEDNLLLQKIDEPMSPPKKTLKRRYLEVEDRRMPWSLFPDTITQTEKARTLAVYIKLMSVNTYRQARLSSHFVPWPAAIQIAEESTRIQPTRSTRSGRSAPVYASFDDDDDLDFVVKPKKRKTSNSEETEFKVTGFKQTTDGGLIRLPGLKRKSSKDDNSRSVKESKMDENHLEVVCVKPNSRIDTILNLVED